MPKIAKKRKLRTSPNILVTGTPGTGKTTTSKLISECTGMRYLNVGDYVKERNLHSGWDEGHQSFILDEKNEDQALDAMEDQMTEGSNIVDYHSSDLFPERWFDIVVVLMSDNTVLYERLEARGYPPEKIMENVQCEIMHVSVEEAREAYRPDVVRYMTSNSMEDMARNVTSVQTLLREYNQQTSH